MVSTLFSVTDIEKPQHDNREYEFFRLPNNLDVTIVSDPETEKAAAAMDVHVGHLSDPEDIPGLAHFCEHMLFLGTKKYPEESAYKNFIAEHGGQTNAFTGTENTNFFFDVAADYLEDSLDFFSQFFISPLFTADATSRELKAVDSENSKNLQSDMFRMFQLLKHLSNKDFPFHKFGTGNLKTLETIPKEHDIDVRKALLEFHDKYYSANIMKLSVIGKEPLETLKAWAIEKFSDVENKNISVPSFPSKPFLKEHVGRHVCVVPVKDKRDIEIYWPIPPQQSLYKKLPTRYYSHLLGHEGPGSLFAYLKHRGWAESLGSGEAHSGTDYSTFLVQISLTEEGDQHVSEIIDDVYRYINLLRQEGVKKWIFDESASLSDIEFRFAERIQPFFYSSKIAGSMQIFEPRDIIAGASKIREYDHDLLEDFLQYLTPENHLSFHISKQHDGNTDYVEPWYETRYSVEYLSSSRIEDLKNKSPNNSLYLPEPNPFVPQSLALKAPPKESEDLKHPQCASRNELSRLWFKQDTHFKTPKTAFGFYIRLPITYSTPENILMARLFVDLVKDSLNEYAYSADIAGLRYEVSAAVDGMWVMLYGYNDKIEVLTCNVFERIRNLEIKPDRFEIMKEKLVRKYRNFMKDQPYQHALERLSYITFNHKWSIYDYLKVVSNIDVNRLEQFRPQWLRSMNMEVLILGNIKHDEARDVVHRVSEILNAESLLPSQQPDDRIVQLPADQHSIFKNNSPNDDDPNSAIEVIYQIGIRNTKEDVLLDLLVQIMSNDVFETLRTQEQLGYIVFTGLRQDNNVQALRVLVQSSAKGPEYIDSRIEEVVGSIETKIEEMPEETYKSYVSSLIQKKRQKDQDMFREAMRHWKEISNRSYQFDRGMINLI
eukprot:gb/GECH01008226.1/.p1 GENE.gb/GECH01008226.1/~~gb/GECH01008226.1/.p1  ORF type:complete len:885 (+),score=190.80 gb/GECH01008226.1/:1-2655(+)